jgi:hypothetical protein
MIQTKTIAVLLLIAIAATGVTMTTIGTGIVYAPIPIKITCPPDCPHPPPQPGQNSQGNDNSGGNEQQGQK